MDWKDYAVPGSDSYDGPHYDEDIPSMTLAFVKNMITHLKMEKRLTRGRHLSLIDVGFVIVNSTYYISIRLKSSQADEGREKETEKEREKERENERERQRVIETEKEREKEKREREIERERRERKGYFFKEKEKK